MSRSPPFLCAVLVFLRRLVFLCCAGLPVLCWRQLALVVAGRFLTPTGLALAHRLACPNYATS